MGDEGKHLEEDELASERADLLPDREALSLLSTDPMSDFGSIDDVAATSPPGAYDAGTADQASGTADAASGMAADASASESESPSMTEADRSEQITQSDSASATS